MFTLINNTWWTKESVMDNIHNHIQKCILRCWGIQVGASFSFFVSLKQNFSKGQTESKVLSECDVDPMVCTRKVKGSQMKHHVLWVCCTSDAHDYAYATVTQSRVTNWI
jgi:hypothetical protein